MKKIALLLIVALSIPIGMMAQDDLYFVPSKNKKEVTTTRVQTAPVATSNTNVYTTPGSTVVIQERNGNTRDVDEYNRRYSSRDY